MSTDQSATQRNRAIVERFYAVAATGDTATIDQILADSIEVHEPPFLPYGRVYSGKDEVRDLMRSVGAYLDMSKSVVHYTIAHGQRVAACVGMPDRATGHMTHFLEESTVRDGKIVAMTRYCHDAQSLVRVREEKRTQPHPS